MPDHEAELSAIPAARKGPPKWMTFVGCGCLIPGFLAVAWVAYSVQMFRTLTDQQNAWTELAELVSYDDSVRGEPSGEPDDPRTRLDESRLDAEFSMIIGGPVPFSGGVEAYHLGRDVPTPGLEEDAQYGPNPMSVTFVKIRSDQAEAAAEAPAGTPLHQDMTLEIAGVELRGRRIPEMVSDSLLIQATGLTEVRGAGAVLWLREGFTDPDEDDESFDLLVYFQRPESSTPITDAEMTSFLGAFDIAGTAERDARLAGESAADPEYPDGATEGEGAGEPGSDGEGR